MKNFNNNRAKLSFPFFVLALILAITFFLVSAGSFQYYRTRISILFIPKSGVLSTHTPYVMENLVRLPRMLSFYERMLRDNGNLTDEFSGKSKDEKKKSWNKALDIKKDGGSSIINIQVTSKNRTQSVELTKQTVRTLFNTASFYYNIKSDADFRIIDGPTTAPALKYWLWLLPSSVLLGFIASFLLNAIFSLLIGVIKRLWQRFQLTKQKPGILEKVKVEKEASFAFPKIKTTIKKSKAPENLPIEEELSSIPPAIGDFETTEGAEVEAPRKSDTAELPEPTEEELKKRLNQLLRGEL